MKALFHFFEFSKNVISKFSGPLLIEEKDSLDVLLLYDISLQLRKGRNGLTHTFCYANLTNGY